MKIDQISVFLENRKGRLLEVCALLGEQGINIEALSIAESEKFGILRMVVDQPDRAVSLIQSKKLTAEKTELIAVEVEDRPGGLAGILARLADHGINVEYMYGFPRKTGDKAVMVLRVECPEKAMACLGAL